MDLHRGRTQTWKAFILVPSVLKGVPVVAPVTPECTGWCRVCLWGVRRTDRWPDVCLYKLLDLTYSLQELDPVESYTGNICVWTFTSPQGRATFNKPFIFPRSFQCNQCPVAESTHPFSCSWTPGYRRILSEGRERWLSQEAVCCESLKT